MEEKHLFSIMLRPVQSLAFIFDIFRMIQLSALCICVLLGFSNYETDLKTFNHLIRGAPAVMTCEDILTVTELVRCSFHLEI